MKLIVGLGNPGYEYQLTPHNVGFMAVDRLAESCGVEVARREAQALTAATQIEHTDVVLAKPLTYMNLSGIALARLLENYGLTPADLMVLSDDVNLPFGSLRIRRRGSAGGHNGLKSVIGALQSGEFVRVRLGVKPDEPVEDLVSYVLRRFRKDDLEAVADMLDAAEDAVKVILKEGTPSAMNRFNRRVTSPEA